MTCGGFQVEKNEMIVPTNMIYPCRVHNRFIHYIR